VAVAADVAAEEGRALAGYVVREFQLEALHPGKRQALCPGAVVQRGFAQLGEAALGIAGEAGAPLELLGFAPRGKLRRYLGIVW
jgi:hypothetical protein